MLDQSHFERDMLRNALTFDSAMVCVLKIH